MVSVSGASGEQRDGYTYWDVPAGNMMTLVIGNGDSWQNHHIDITASGASFRCHNATGWGASQPASWTLANIGIEGVSGLNNTPCFSVGCSDEALMENIYIGDGEQMYPNWSNRFAGCAGIIVDRGHTGHLEIRGANVQGWVDNGIYGTPPSLESNGGTLHYQDVYGSYNNNANIRIGRGSVDNCCTVVTGAGSNEGGWGLTLRDAGPTDVSNTVCYDESPSAGNSWGIVTLAGGSGSFTNVKYNTGTESGVSGPPNYTGSADSNASESDVFLPDLAPATPEAAYTGDPSGGSPSSGPGGGGDGSFSGRQIPFIEFEDMYLENIDGVAIWAGSVNENAEYTIENVHINEAEVGILVEGGPVDVNNSEILAQDAIVTENGGEANVSDTNMTQTGSSGGGGGQANPQRPEEAPTDAQDAMENAS